MFLSAFRKFESNPPLTEHEAWTLFRMAAIAEACGWSLLILGILAKRYIVPGNDIPVLIAGRLHGIIFLLYLIAAVGLYPSLRWSRGRAIIAILASVPPYATLLFEQWSAHRRNRAHLTIYSRSLAYAMVTERIS